MKRKNMTYEYETDRETIEELPIEQMLKEFRKASNERRKKNKNKKNHRR